MCGLKGCGFSAILVINKVSILADSGHFAHKYKIRYGFFTLAFFGYIFKSNRSPSQIMSTVI